MYINQKQVQDLFEQYGLPRPSRTYLHRMVSEGRFPAPRKIGVRVCFVETEVLDWLKPENHPVVSYAEEAA